jgi:hypothetical protein
MKAISHVRSSMEKQQQHGNTLDQRISKIRTMAEVQSTEQLDIIADGGESGRTLLSHSMQRFLEPADSAAVDTVIIAKLDRITRSITGLVDSPERPRQRCTGERSRIAGHGDGQRHVGDESVDGSFTIGKGGQNPPRYVMASSLHWWSD